MKLNVADETVRLLIDTGSSDLVLFGSQIPAALTRFPWRGDKTVHYASGAAWLRFVELRRVSLGDQSWDKLPAWALDRPLEGYPAGLMVFLECWPSASTACVSISQSTNSRGAGRPVVPSLSTFARLAASFTRQAGAIIRPRTHRARLAADVPDCRNLRRRAVAEPRHWPGGRQSPRAEGDDGARVSGRTGRSDGLEGPADRVRMAGHSRQRRCAHPRDLRAPPPVRRRCAAATRHRDDSEGRLSSDRDGGSWTAAGGDAHASRHLPSCVARS